MISLSLASVHAAWLAMEEHDGTDSASVGDNHFSYSTNTESESSTATRASTVHRLLRLLVARSPTHT